MALNTVPSNVKVKTVREIASMHGLKRMDCDVFAERQLIKEGVPHDTPLILSNLQKVFGNFVALRDMSFHIPKHNEGCVFALLGPNGAAKTTALNLMIGL